MPGELYREVFEESPDEVSAGAGTPAGVPVTTGECAEQRGLPAPTFLCPCKEKSPPERWKRNTVCGLSAMPKDQTGGLLRRCRLSPEASYRVRRTLCRFGTAPPQVGAWVVNGVQNRKAPACWPRAFRFATPYRGGYRLLPGYARSEAERAGREGQSFRFSTTTTAGLPRYAAESCRIAKGFSVLGRRPASYRRSV